MAKKDSQGRNFKNAVLLEMLITLCCPRCDLPSARGGATSLDVYEVRFPQYSASIEIERTPQPNNGRKEE